VLESLSLGQLFEQPDGIGGSFGAGNTGIRRLAQPGVVGQSKMIVVVADG
jgi:hypothetical protein